MLKDSVKFVTVFARDLSVLAGCGIIYLLIRNVTGYSFSKDIAQAMRISIVPIACLLGYHIGRVIFPNKVTPRVRVLLAAVALLVLILMFTAVY